MTWERDMKTATIEQKSDSRTYQRESVLRFEEGLIGFAECKNFVLMENPDIAPLRLLQFEGSTDISFLVLDPRVRMTDYYDQIPNREWEALGVMDPSKRLA